MNGKSAGVVAIGAGAALAITGAVLYFRSRGMFGLGRAAKTVSRTRVDGMKLTHFRDSEMPIQQRVGIIQDLVWKSIQDPRMRKIALKVTKHCPARDGACEAKAIYNFVRKNVRYTGDVGTVKMGRRGPAEGVDLFQSAYRTLEFGGGDCLPAGTLLLVEGHRLVPIEDVLPGSKIWGLDRWSDVGDVWYKGELPIDAIQLNNGSWFKATPDHKVYVAECSRHELDRASGPCWCPVSEREIKRIRVAELTEKMVLITPDRLPFGDETRDPDRALIEGLYLSDGWCSHDSDFDISGRDGHPKEAQKRLVQEICQQLGIDTTWFDKSIRVRDPEWALRMQQMGHYAPQKHALSINLDEGTAGALLRGIMADSGANTNGNGRTFTSTSRQLALQTRLLWKMFGVTCSERYIENHGGLGQNPIWRLGVRDQNRSDGKAEKFLRVKTIERAVDVVPVWDISTDDHYVYLPEADVTVSNCDDQTILNSTLLALNGINPRMRVTAPRGGTWQHIYALAGLPKNSPNKWVALDTTLPNGKFGTEVPFGKKRDFVA